MKRSSLWMCILTTCFVWLTAGCASKGYVDDQLNQALTAEIGRVRQNMDDVRQGIQKNRQEIDSLKSETQARQERLARKMNLIDEALKRAGEAKKLAKGKLLYEVTLTDESVHFGYKKSTLSDEAKAALDAFAQDLIAGNEAVFIEIQGHTDHVGSDEYNLELGQDRADSVRKYLNTDHNIPLHRMSTISYGESKPLEPNDTKSNRAQNRRVVLLVME